MGVPFGDHATNHRVDNLPRLFARTQGYENKDFSSAYEYIQEVDCDSTFDKK